MAEDTGIDISDSVVMGGVQQNITNVRSDNRECSSCGATNVVIMKCQEGNCTASFCQICHPDCRFLSRLILHIKFDTRFDSGVGTGPFCRVCLAVKFAVDNETRERLKTETRERLEEQKRETWGGELNNLKVEYVHYKRLIYSIIIGMVMMVPFMALVGPNSDGGEEFVDDSPFFMPFGVIVNSFCCFYPAYLWLAKGVTIFSNPKIRIEQLEKII